MVRVCREAGAPEVPLLPIRSNDDGVRESPEAGGVERPHVEDVDALNLAEDLETLQTRGLVVVGWDAARGCPWWEEVLGGINF